MCRRHVTGVDGGLELIGIYLCVKLFQLGHVEQKVLEVERLEGSRGWIAVHADGATGIDEEYFRVVRHRLRRIFAAKIRKVSQKSVIFAENYHLKTYKLNNP
jgi:hypothetical protein